MEKSRVKNSINNAKSAMMMQLINKILAFVVRTVFIKILNTEYLGINGLFTNILTMLSVAELGIGTAIIFSMYKPIAENNQEKLKSLMKYYKKSYNIIGIVIFALGLCVIPFMGFLIKDVPNIKENITFIYLLFLCNTTISYFFTYKRSIIIAYQQESIISKIDSVCFLFKSIFEIIVLNVFRNYVIYLIISIIYTLVENLIVSRKAKTMFPFLKDKDVKALSNHEKKHIFLNVKSLVVYKIGSIIMSGTDNILISALINVYTVGLCSNYTMIINAIRSVITSAFNGITASVGNLNAEKDKDKKENVFYQITFINFWIYSFCTIALIILLDHFIKIWLGQEYVLGIGVSIALALGVFFEGLRMPAYTYRETLGLFKRGKITPYIGIVVNIVSSIILCKIFGVVGIFIGTIIAQLSSYSWIDPYLIHKYCFRTPVKKYIKKFIIYCLEFTICLAITSIFAAFVANEGIIGFIIKVCIVCVVPNLLIFILSYKTEELNEVKKKIKFFI